jgi:hypothetical protein
LENGLYHCRDCVIAKKEQWDEAKNEAKKRTMDHWMNDDSVISFLASQFKGGIYVIGRAKIF